MTERKSKVALHTIQPIVTPDKFEFGLHRIRLPGGWGYWLQPIGGGAPVSFVVPETDDDFEPVVDNADHHPG